MTFTPQTAAASVVIVGASITISAISGAGVAFARHSIPKIARGVKKRWTPTTPAELQARLDNVIAQNIIRRNQNRTY